jgi:hypothetical protein
MCGIWQGNFSILQIQFLQMMTSQEITVTDVAT